MASNSIVTLKDTLDKFHGMFHSLRTIRSSAMGIKYFDNLVIGGSYALILHGLQLGRSLADVDILVIEPTGAEIDFLSKAAPSVSIAEYIDGSEGNSHKISIGTATVDFLIDSDTSIAKLLHFIHNNHSWPVQSISNVMAAKNSYVKQVGDKKTFRIKDIKDVCNLRDLNFKLLS